jgi:hypothetical protein
LGDKRRDTDDVPAGKIEQQVFFPRFQTQSAADDVTRFEYLVLFEKGRVVSDDPGSASQKIISLKRW